MGLSNPTIANPIAFPQSTTNYKISVTDLKGCIGKDSIMITVNPLPIISTNNDTAICQNQSTQLFATGGVKYNWSPNNNLNSSSVSNPIASPKTTTVYSLTVTDFNNCSSIKSNIVVYVNKLPNVSAGNDTSICFGNSILLKASGGVQYKWESSNLSNQLISNPIANPLNSTNYKVFVFDGNGCMDTSSVNINVFPLPNAKTGGDKTICKGDTIELQSSGGIIYSWFPSLGLNSSAINNPKANPLSTIKYIVNVTDNKGCSNKDSLTVTVKELPSIEIIGDTLVCNNSYWEMYRSKEELSSYKWSVIGGELQSSISSPTAFIHWLNGSSGNVSLNALDLNNGCKNDAKINVNISPNIAPNISKVKLKSGNVFICEDSIYSNYQWGYESKITRMPILTCANKQYCQFPFIDLSNNYYWVITSNANGCETKSYYNAPNLMSIDKSEKANINIFPNPVTENLHIDFTEWNNNNFSIELFDLKGQKVIENEIIKNESLIIMNCSELTKGMYQLIIKDKSGEKLKNSKIIIE